MSEDRNQNNENYSRRDFVKIGAVAGLTAAVSGALLSRCSSAKSLTTPESLFTAGPVNPVRIGFVGVGLQGTGHVRNFLNIEGVEVNAVCDIVDEKVKRIQEMVVEAGQPMPKGYSRGDTDFMRLCEQEDLDIVFTATPWEWHVPVVLSAMENGKHAATEIPAAYTLDDCWSMVETSERTKKYCIMMENCNYDRREMMFLNMVRQGVFGELIHGEAGYRHDLRRIKFENRNEGLWRREHAKNRNGNLYPTHGLSPVAQCMDINRGDRFDYLVSMSSNSRGLQLYAKENFEPDDPRANEKYKLGDVNISLIKTVLGKTITLYHDCNLPRPYSRENLIQGTKGIAHGYPDRVYIEGRGRRDRWVDLEELRDEFEHPLWTAKGDAARNAGHGGMDYIEDYRLIRALQTGTPPDMDVYDAAAISAVCELSEISVANNSKPVDFPDFTRGAWKTREPLGIVEA